MRRLSACKRLGRDRQGAVPEFVEGRGELFRDRASDEHVVVRKLGIGVDLKVLVTDIASAEERCGIVHDEQLIVHSVVEPGGIEGEFGGTSQDRMAAICKRIEDSQLDRWMSLKGRELFIARVRLAIIDQYPHTYAAIGRMQHRTGQQPAGISSVW